MNINYNEVIHHLGLKGALDHSSYERMCETWIDKPENLPSKTECEAVWNKIMPKLYKKHCIKVLSDRSFKEIEKLYKKHKFKYKLENAISKVYDENECKRILMIHSNTVNKFRNLFYLKKYEIELAETIEELESIIESVSYPAELASEEEL